MYLPRHDTLRHAVLAVRTDSGEYKVRINDSKYKNKITF